MIKKFITENRIFLFPYFALLAIAFTAILLHAKTDLQFLVNQYHNDFGDSFFPIATKFGEGFPVIALVLYLVATSYKKLIAFASAYIFGGIFVLLGKWVIFSEVLRPKTVMTAYENYHWIEGVKLSAMHSFPSGHTQSAFTIYFFAALLTKNPLVKFLLFATATLIGFSRVYISQHFVIDITVGSIIAVVSVALWWMFWEKKAGKKLEKGLLKK